MFLIATTPDFFCFCDFESLFFSGESWSADVDFGTSGVIAVLPNSGSSCATFAVLFDVGRHSVFAVGWVCFCAFVFLVLSAVKIE